MAKRTPKTTTVVDTYVPVYIPTTDGYGDLELGKATVKGGTLLVEFNNKLPSMAILNRIARGEIVGLTFVIPQDEAEEAEREEKVREATAAQEIPEEETEEERKVREAEEETQAKVDQAFLDAELERLEEE